jgi:succinate dehydrogenase / fumarate reductase flavoprotein subunit
MQGLADGYFIIPYTISDYLAITKLEKVDLDHPACRQTESEVAARINKLLDIKGRRTVDSIHQELGKLMWDYCGMARNEQGLKYALKKIPEIQREFWGNANVVGRNEEFNQALEKAGRVADFLELAELMCYDALARAESCGCHFREEFQTADGEAQRDDENYCNVSAWEYTGCGIQPRLHKESLTLMDREGFGNCTMHRECEAVCPKEISVSFIARMNREYLWASLTQSE